MDNNIKTKFFTTGYLPHKVITEVRQKQGLQTQDLSNDCRETPRVMYPTPVTALPTYGLPPIPSDCNCTIYLQPP
jgi:hypothetical protein